MKPVLCLDFDGVIHSYDSGWRGAAVIPDGPVAGAVEFIYNATEKFRVAIFSSRSCAPGGIDAMRGWLRMHVTAAIDDKIDIERILALIEWPTEKPAAFLTIDDRAITFTGEWPKLNTLLDFKPWNKKELAA